MGWRRTALPADVRALEEDAADVFEADVVPAAEERAYFGGERQRLCAAGAGTPAEVLVGDGGSSFRFGRYELFNASFQSLKKKG